MPTLELVHDRGCPHVEAARASLERACEQAGLPPRWTEHASDDAPPHARGYGSPTILVDGRDVAGAGAGAAECCRVYAGADGALRGVPDASIIVRALAASVARGRGGWRAALGVVPGVAAALLPRVACPACWPAYAGVLGALGVPVLMDVRWLLPLTSAALVLALSVLAYRARRRRGYGPVAVGLAAAALVLVGKFVLEADAATYSGTALLVGATVWNAWPARPTVAALAPTR